MTASRSIGGAAFVAALGLAALTLTACTSGTTAPGSSAPPPSVASVPPASVTPVTSTPTSSAPPTSPSPSSTPPSSSVPAPTPSPTAQAFTTTCSDLTVRVIPGGAIRGAEIAALQYVNDGTTTCTITGTPTARLILNGSEIGSPSRPNGTSGRAFTLAPGDTAESLLTDITDCNAPLSDTIRVTLPDGAGSAQSVVRPAKLRACVLRVAPLGPPA